MAEGGEERSFILLPTHAGKRLDAVLAAHAPDHSRSYLSKLLKDGAILVDGRSPKASYKVRGGEQVEIEFPAPEIIEARAEQIPLDVVFEDTDIIVINKPPGMPAHPSAGHGSGTLVNALLGHCKDLSAINGALRPGIVHRLDMDTSGVIVAAKNDRAHQALQDQFMARTVRKRYLALSYGSPLKDKFSADGRIGRHPVRRTEMTVLRGSDEGREAFTEFEVMQRLKLDNQPVCLVLALPKTGRTHQIRVHLAKAGYPILADGLYGREAGLPALALARHALHAWKLEIAHPRSGEKMCFEAPLADDIRGALLKLGGRWPA